MLDISVGDRTYVRLPTTLGDYTALTNVQKGIGAIKNETQKVRHKGFMWWLNEVVPFDFPTATQDESLTVLPVAPLGYGALPASYNIAALYADQDSGDIVSKTVPGGSFNPRRLFANMVTNGLAQPTAGQNLLDTQVTPKSLNPIIDATNTLAGYKFSSYMWAYDASALGTTTGANANGKPTRLHVNDVDIELYEPETTEGMFLDRDSGNELCLDLATEQSFVPKDPYVFHQNRRIRIQLDTAQKAGAGANYGANTQLFAMFGIREPES
jgi:hypothetical protein